MCQTPVENAKAREPGNVQTAKDGAESGAQHAGAVTAAVGCDALNAAELAVTLSGDADLVDLARAFVEADRARWRSMVNRPYNGKGPDHWHLVEVASVAWVAWVTALTARGIEVGDRRGLAVEVAKR